MPEIEQIFLKIVNMSITAGCEEFPLNGTDELGKDGFVFTN